MKDYLSTEEVSSLLNVEGHQMIIDVFGFGFTDKTQTVKTCSVNFHRRNNEDEETRYSEMVGFNCVFSALSLILKTAETLAKNIGVDVIISECANEKRARVYSKMAQKCGYKSDLCINEYMIAVKIYLN